jgi:hypothetical protein
LFRSLAIFAERSFAGPIAKSLLRRNEEVPDLVNIKNKFIAFLQTNTVAKQFEIKYGNS